MSFLDDVIIRAKRNKKKIVLPEGMDPRVIKAASMAKREDISDIILIGNKESIVNEAMSLNVDITGIEIEDPSISQRSEDLANKLYEIRKRKGMTHEQAKEIIKNETYYGVMLVNEGIADGMVAGAVNSTAETIRPALQILKTSQGTKLVSSFFVMVLPNKDFGYNGVMVFADCGVIENPNSEQLAEIAVSSAKSFKMLVEAEPVVAMLSYSSYGSAKSEQVDKVSNAVKIAKQQAPDLILDGELQADAALVESVSRRKAPGNAVDGNANVLVFPDISSGNISYKLIERLANAQAYGPIMQGIAKPVNDLSRGCSSDDIKGVIAITVVQAQSI